jgi:hypothetical protein
MLGQGGGCPPLQSAVRCPIKRKVLVGARFPRPTRASPYFPDHLPIQLRIVKWSFYGTY